MFKLLNHFKIYKIEVFVDIYQTLTICTPRADTWRCLAASHVTDDMCNLCISIVIVFIIFHKVQDIHNISELLFTVLIKHEHRLYSLIKLSPIHFII